MSETAKNSRARTIARTAAVQSLYQIELSGDSVDLVIASFTEDHLPLNADRVFYNHLVREAAAMTAAVDGWLVGDLPSDWSLSRLDAVLRALLRAAITELLTRGDVHPLVTISEFVAVAHEFFSGKEPGLVHSILDRVAHKCRAADFESMPLDATNQQEVPEFLASEFPELKPVTEEIPQ